MLTYPTSKPRIRVRRSRLRVLAFVVAAVIVGALLAACSGGASGSDSPGRINVLASTSVWGDIAASVGDDRVSVTSVISDLDQDPHSYEASSRTLLEAKDADLLIENGGGYDDFMGKMASTVGSDAPVVNAVAISGHQAPAGGELNEHVWYDFPTVEKVADAIAVKLGQIAPRHAAEFAANAKALDAKVDGLITAERRVRADGAGAGVAITEPVPLYMLDAMGLDNLTPEAFSSAVEESTDVSARVLAQTLALYSRHEVAVLVYNAQTSGPITEQVKAAAATAGIAVVPVTETMPPGTTYVAWMTRTVAAVREALATR